jgi:membrane protein insertase Oxa1/YidC/SpoIIIJ
MSQVIVISSSASSWSRQLASGVPSPFQIVGRVGFTFTCMALVISFSLFTQIFFTDNYVANIIVISKHARAIKLPPSPTVTAAAAANQVATEKFDESEDQIYGAGGELISFSCAVSVYIYVSIATN